MTLTTDQKLFWDENGYLPIPDVVPMDHIQRMRSRIEELCRDWDSDEAKRVGVQQEADYVDSRTSMKSSQTVRKMMPLVPNEPVFEEHARNPCILDMTADLIGTAISLYADQALLKPPSIGTIKVPHQDNAHFNVNPHEALITCWCALDDATLENGCLHYMAGAHKLGLIPHEKLEGTPHLTPVEFDQSKTVPVPMTAGGIIFHHSLTFHWSPENKTDRWRRAFICHFVRSDAEMPGMNPENIISLR